MTSKHFQEIDDLTRGEHRFLEPKDRCLFYGEYTSRADYHAGPINDRVSNFKKSVERKAYPAEWRWKLWAIEQIAQAMLDSFPVSFLNAVTWVPVPPSKAKTDPLYDDRLLAVFNIIRKTVPTIDVRELVLQTMSLTASHTSTATRDPSLLLHAYQFQQHLIPPPVNDVVAVFDDVLTTGSHFRAMSDFLQQQFPNVEIIGVFYARAVPKSDLMPGGTQAP